MENLIDYECIIKRNCNKLSLRDIIEKQTDNEYRVICGVRKSTRGVYEVVYIITNKFNGMEIGKSYKYQVYTGRNYGGKGDMKVRNIIDIKSNNINAKVPSLVDFSKKQSTYVELR